MDEQGDKPDQEKEHDSDTIDGPLYFPVSPLKLIVLSVCTFGLYKFYWFYKNWCLIKERESSLSMQIGFRDSGIMPFWRALFTVLYCYHASRTFGQQHKSVR